MSRFNLKIGPFHTGMNNRDIVLDENQMRQITNMEIAPTGSLRFRRPFNKMKILNGVTPQTKNRILGTIVDINGDKQYVVYVFNGKMYATTVGADYLTFTHYDLGTVPTIDDINGIFTYDSKYWVIGKTLTSYSSPIQNFKTYSAPNAWTEITTGPIAGKIYGTAFMVYKERLFVATPLKVYYSAVYDFTKWVNPDGGLFVLGSGSGEVVNFMIVMNSALYMFSNFRTFSLRFEDSITTDAVLRNTNAQGARGGCFWKDKLFVISGMTLYEYFNDLYYQKAMALQLTDSHAAIIGMTAVDDGIILMYNNGQTFLYYPTYQSYVEFEFNFIGTGISLVERPNSAIPAIVSDISSQFSFTIMNDSLGNIYAVPYHYHIVEAKDFYDRDEFSNLAYTYDVEIITGEYDAQNPHMVKVLNSGYIVGSYLDQVSSIFSFYGLNTNSKMTQFKNVRTFDEVQHFITPDKRVRTIEFGMSYIASDIVSLTLANRTNRYFNLKYFLVDTTMVHASAVETGV